MNFYSKKDKKIQRFALQNISSFSLHFLNASHFYKRAYFQNRTIEKQEQEVFEQHFAEKITRIRIHDETQMRIQDLVRGARPESPGSGATKTFASKDPI